MKITSHQTAVQLTDEIVERATGLTGSGMIKIGRLKFKHMRVRKDAQGWFVMRGSRGHDKVRIVSADIIAIDGGDPSITFNL